MSDIESWALLGGALAIGFGIGVILGALWATR